MRKPAAWFAGALGIAGLWRLLRRRRAPGGAAVETPPADDPAEALRAKLAETRVAEPEHEHEDGPAGKPASIDERRKAIHEAARAAIEEMHGAGGNGEPGSREPGG